MSLFVGNEVFYCCHCEDSIVEKYAKKCPKCNYEFSQPVWYICKFFTPIPTVPFWKFWKKQKYKPKWGTQQEICDKLLNH